MIFLERDFFNVFLPGRPTLVEALLTLRTA